MAEEAHHVSIRVENPERPNMDSVNPNNTELSTQKMEGENSSTEQLRKLAEFKSPAGEAEQNFRILRDSDIFKQTTKYTERENKDEELYGRLKKAAEGHNKSGENEHGNREETKDKIHRFLNMMRDKYGIHYFKPTKIAIGPIHANSSDTSKFEELKNMWAAKYLDGLESKKILEKIRHEIENEELLKKFFHEKGVYMDGDDLARMLLVDGCAVLQFIYSYVWGDSSEDLNIKEDEASVVLQDLFLLENQIPFRVLEIIIEEGPNKEQEAKPGQLKEKDKRHERGGTSKKGGASWNSLWGIGSQPADDYYTRVTKMEETLKLFIRMSNVALAPIFHPDQSDPLKAGASVHLLDLLRRALVGDGCSSSANSLEYNWRLIPRKLPVFIFRTLPLILLRCLVFLVLFLVLIFGWLLYALFKLITKLQYFAGIKKLSEISLLLLLVCIFGGSSQKTSPISRRSFCIVQDVKQAGIKLKPSESSCLSDVGFSSGFLSVNGCLKLLPMLLDESTPYKLLNLVAYEMCPSTTTDRRSYAVTSYLSFLESLIEDAQDVKDLKAAHILRYRLRNDIDRLGNNGDDCLRNDDDVVRLIRKISPSLVPEDVFSNDSAELREYCRRSRPVWAAIFRQMYLSSPWAFIALIGALLGLILTGISTYFAAFPK